VQNTSLKVSPLLQYYGNFIYRHNRFSQILLHEIQLCNAYLGTTITDLNCMQEEIKSRLNSGNVRYHSVQSLLS
jgi:uncharacterized protein YqgQ